MAGEDRVEKRAPILLIVCGLPFSGKTTMSIELADALDNAVHVDMDAINVERGLGVDAAAISSMEWADTYRIAYERAENALSEGIDVVFDAANYSRAQRDILRASSRGRGADSAVIFVDVPVDESRSRWLANQESLGTDDVRVEDFERIVDRFDPPQGDERVLLFYPGMPVADLVSGIRQVFAP